MSDLAQAPSLTPRRARYRRRRHSGAMRFSLDGVPEQDRTAVYREVFGQEVLKYDLEPLPDVPLEVDLKFQTLPGLMMMSGRSHGSRNRADPRDDRRRRHRRHGLLVNLRGPHRVTHGREELVLGDGEATLVSSAEICSFTHRPPGDLLALRVPRQQFAPRVTGVDDCYFRRIPRTLRR